MRSVESRPAAVVVTGPRYLRLATLLLQRMRVASPVGGIWEAALFRVDAAEFPVRADNAAGVATLTAAGCRPGGDGPDLRTRLRRSSRDVT
jgi:hypothetical protein